MRRKLFVSLVAFWTCVGAAAPWTPDPGRSQLGFVATYDGVEFEALFRSYQTVFQFDPEQLDASRIEVVVDLGSVDSASADRDEGMRDTEWFDVASHPQARFVSTKFTSLGDDRYEVRGDLTIKEITHPIALPFTWAAATNEAHFTGSTTVKRTDFRIGTGEWETDETIGFAVRIVVALVLVRQS